MSVEAFNTFANALDIKSPEFLELARSVSSAPDLAVYAARHGFTLSEDEASQVIASAQRELEANGLKPLSGDDLDQVVGGVSWQAIVGGGAALVGGVAMAVFTLPALATGASVGFVAGMIGGTTVASGGLGSMVGSVIDLVKGD